MGDVFPGHLQSQRWAATIIFCSVIMFWKIWSPELFCERIGDIAVSISRRRSFSLMGYGISSNNGLIFIWMKHYNLSQWYYTCRPITAFVKPGVEFLQSTVTKKYSLFIPLLYRRRSNQLSYVMLCDYFAWPFRCLHIGPSSCDCSACFRIAHLFSSSLMSKLCF